MPAPDRPRISEIRPLWAVEGGRVTLRGSGFPVDDVRLPQVRIGALEARVVRASATALDVVVPDGIEGGSAAGRLTDLPGATAFLAIGQPIARDLRTSDRRRWRVVGQAVDGAGEAMRDVQPPAAIEGQRGCVGQAGGDLHPRPVARHAEQRLGLVIKALPAQRHRKL